MTAPTATHPAPEWLRELAAGRTRYEEMLGWPVRMEVTPRRLTVPVGTTFDALSMPAALGERVLTWLRIAMLAGPVTTSPDGDEWVLLAQPAPAPRPSIPAELCRLGVRPAPRGASIVIPTPTRGGSERGERWIEPPRTDRSLPPWPVLIGATRRVAAGMAGSVKAPQL